MPTTLTHTLQQLAQYPEGVPSFLFVGDVLARLSDRGYAEVIEGRALITNKGRMAVLLLPAGASLPADAAGKELARIDRAKTLAEGARAAAEAIHRDDIVAVCDRIIGDCEADAERVRRGEVLI